LGVACDAFYDVTLCSFHRSWIFGREVEEVETQEWLSIR